MTTKFVRSLTPACWKSGMNANYLMLKDWYTAIPKSSYMDYIPVYHAYRSPSFDDQIILLRWHAGIPCLPVTILWWPDHPTSMTYQYTMLTGHHPLMTRPSYFDDMLVYHAYRSPSFDDQTILLRWHIGIPCLPVTILWWPDHPTSMTCWYTMLTGHHPSMTRSSYFDDILVYHAYRSPSFDDQTILLRWYIDIGFLQEIPLKVFASWPR
jgi:hypothetical protein